MTQPPRYREITVSGPPRELGRQIGEAARDEIHGFAAVSLERVNKTVPVSRTRALEIATQCVPLVEDYAPHLLEELRGMSEASGVSFDELMMLQVRNQFTPDPGSGCTSFSVGPAATTTAQPLIGQNWDNDSALDPFTVVLTRHAEGQPSLMTLTQAGLIAYIGLNDAGIAACLNTLPAPSRPVGVPHYFTLRCLYEATCLDDAVAAIRRAKRAIPANIMLSTPEGPADLEVTLDNVFVLRDTGDGVVTHSNHCLHSELVAINDQFDELIESKPRKQRIDALLHSAARSLDLATLKTALRDHDNFPTSICRHTNDHPQHGFWQTVFSVILDPHARAMHVARGTPCDRDYEVYQMA